MSLRERGCDDGDMESLAVATAAPRQPPAAGVHRATGRGDDSALCGPTWFAIADGMGGHPDGHVASRVAVDVLAAQPAPTSLDEVIDCIGLVDGSVRAAAQHSRAFGMGTTLVAATAIDGGAAVVHLGDSRCYRLAHGALTLLTRDHSYVQEMVDLGRLSPDRARHHRLRHVVTRALGVDGAADPDTTFVPGPVGRLLLCSDGLTAELSPRAIGRVMAGIADPRAAAERLVDLAVRCGADDDVTALVVDDLGGRP